MNRKIKYSRYKILLLAVWLSAWLAIYYPYLAVSTYALTLEMGILLLSCSLILWVSKPWDLVLTFLMTLYHSLNIGMQTIYERGFLQFGSIATLINLKSEAQQNTQSALEFIRFSDLRFIFIPLILLMIFSFLFKQRLSTKENHKFIKVFNVTTMILGLLLTSKFYYDVSQSRKTEDDFLYYKTDNYVYVVVPTINQYVSKFGLLSWSVRDLERSFIDPLFSNERNEDSQITQMLQERDSNLPNDVFSGVFKNKSLLIIEAESLNRFAIDKDLTPTLYRLYINGMSMTNYNSPLLLGSTSDAELMANTGLVPSNDGYITFHKYATNAYPLTLAKSFGSIGYKTLAVHNNYGEFYNRSVVMPNLGYEFLDCIGMGFDAQFVDDSEFADKLAWIMVEKDQMLTFWITFNAHQPYGLEDLKPEWVPYLDTVQLKYPNLPLVEQVYLAKNMDLDKGLQTLIQVYEYQNKLDNLVIAIYGDHHPKGAFLNPSNFDSYCLDKGLDTKSCLETPFILWNNDSFVGTKDTVSSTIDISPTIYDLFGIDYNPQQMLGHSVFDSNYNGFYFDASGLISTNDFSYNLVTKELIIKTDISESDAIAQAEELSRELSLGHKIIENDYFKTVTQ